MMTEAARRVAATRVFSKDAEVISGLDIGGKQTVQAGQPGLTYHAWLVSQILSGAARVPDNVSASTLVARALEIADLACEQIAESLKPRQQETVQ